MEKEPLTWDSSRAIAIAIDKKYPNTDVLSLSDRKLMEMLAALEEFKALPPIPDDEKSDILFSIKVALARVIEKDEDYNAHQGDAYV